MARATARQRGVRAAYAKMAEKLSGGAPVANVWTRELIVPDASVAWPHTVERYTLKAYPQIRLVFLNLREDGEFPRGGATPADMFSDPTVQTNTIVPSCGAISSCVRSSCGPDVPWQNYTHAEVVKVIVKLLQLHQPSVVRTLDPQPFERPGSPSGAFPGSIVAYDNLDHTAVARFADEALASYHGPNGTGRLTVTQYKGYSFLDHPRNVGIGAYEDKRAVGEA